MIWIHWVDQYVFLGAQLFLQSFLVTYNLSIGGITFEGVFFCEVFCFVVIAVVIAKISSMNFNLWNYTFSIKKGLYSHSLLIAGLDNVSMFGYFQKIQKVFCKSFLFLLRYFFAIKCSIIWSLQICRNFAPSLHPSGLWAIYQHLPL